MKAKTTAIVTFKVEVHMNQPWDDIFSTSKILAQASHQATEQLLCALKPNMRPIGSPKVTMVMVEEDVADV